MIGIILIVIFFVIIMLTLTGKPQGAQKRIRADDICITQTELERIYAKLNSYIDTYNLINQEYSISFYKLSKEIQEKLDTESMDQLNYVNEEFCSKRDAALEEIEKIKEYASSHQYIYMKSGLQECEDLIDKLHKTSELLKRITPQERENINYGFRQDQTGKIKRDLEEEDNSDFNLFAGCKTEEDAAKRFRALSKVYHPDNESGNEEMFKKMKEEYDLFSKNIRSKEKKNDSKKSTVR